MEIIIITLLTISNKTLSSKEGIVDRKRLLKGQEGVKAKIQVDGLS